MPRPTAITTENVLRAAKLRGMGKQTKEIAVELNLSERTVYALLAQAKQTGAYANFTPWSLAVAMRQGQPGEKAAWLIESDFQWDSLEADWAWLIHQVRGDLPPGLIAAAVVHYMNAEISAKLGWTVRVLDKALWASPWASQEKALAFYQGACLLLPWKGNEVHPSDLGKLYEITSDLRKSWRIHTGQASGIRPEFDMATATINPKVREQVEALMKAHQRDDAATFMTLRRKTGLIVRLLAERHTQKGGIK